MAKKKAKTIDEQKVVILNGAQRNEESQGYTEYPLLFRIEPQTKIQLGDNF